MVNRKLNHRTVQFRGFIDYHGFLRFSASPSFEAPNQTKTMTRQSSLVFKTMTLSKSIFKSFKKININKSNI